VILCAPGISDDVVSVAVPPDVVRLLPIAAPSSRKATLTCGIPYVVALNVNAEPYNDGFADDVTTIPCTAMASFTVFERVPAVAVMVVE
jgi:hypothetical protein